MNGGVEFINQIPCSSSCLFLSITENDSEERFAMSREILLSLFVSLFSWLFCCVILASILLWKIATTRNGCGCRIYRLDSLFFFFLSFYSRKLHIATMKSGLWCLEKFFFLFLSRFLFYVIFSLLEKLKRQWKIVCSVEFIDTFAPDSLFPFSFHSFYHRKL